jgi:glycosyltransferase involved in cell wall biosynthesis
MKISVITTSLVPSNTANSIQAMKAVHALAQNGHQVKLWLPGSGMHPWSDLAEHYGLTTPFDIHWLSCWKPLRHYDFSWLAYRLARRWGPGLIYTWTPQVAILGLQAGLPVVLEVHDRPTGRLGPRLFRRFLKLKGRKRLLVITTALQRKLEQQFGDDLDARIIQIAPNGVDLSRYDNLPEPGEARRRLQLPEGLTIGYTGHFYAGRGMELLHSLAGVFPQVNFLWVGGRPEDVTAWRSRLQQEGLTNVTLTGFIPNAHLPLYQAASDILLMPYETAIAGSGGGNSAEICSPMKMFDYLAAGRAIVTSDLPVLHEVLNENNALFCLPQEKESWIAGIEQLLKDAPKREGMGRNAHQDSARYGWQVRAANALSNL